MDVELLMSAVLLFAGAAIFLFSELFIPAHGVLAVICGLMTAAGVAVCFVIGARTGFIATLGVLIAGPVALTVAVRIYPKSPVGRRIMLQRPSGEAIAGLAKGSVDAAKLLGRRGIAATILRPAGMCDFDGQRVDCLSESEVIVRGMAVEVIRVDGSHVYVRAVTGDTATARPGL